MLTNLQDTPQIMESVRFNDQVQYSSSPPRQAGSPPAMSPPRRSARQRERRDPTVTPKRFRRFFTPISQRQIPGSGRDILGALDINEATNRQPLTPQSSATSHHDSDMALPSSPIARITEQGRTRRSKRRNSVDEDREECKRRAYFFEEGENHVGNTACEELFPGDASGLLDATNQRTAVDARKDTLSGFFRTSRPGVRRSEKTWASTDDWVDRVAIGQGICSLPPHYTPRPLVRFKDSGLSAELLDREHGYGTHHGLHNLSSPACDYRALTANFYSQNLDSYFCNNPDEPLEGVIPFSLASAYHHDFTAIGDERGRVRYLKTTPTTHHDDTKVDDAMDAHTNAIMDLDFSPDDRLLATACGDRTASVFDVETSRQKYLFNQHHDPLRKVTFQPRSCDILATSEKQGAIQIWDLRCAPVPVQTFQGSPEMTTLTPNPVNVLASAHVRLHRDGYVVPSSITSLQWMNPHREHLLLSASESNTVVKLWDTRYIPSRKSVHATPITKTAEPPSHSNRSYGVTSLALNTDGNRIYAVSKDSTVYAYSTEHLLHGTAPELENSPSSKAAKRKPIDLIGPGPLYGLKHSTLSVRSFYVKCAARPLNPSSTGRELLAVGSSDSCAVLFPISENYLKRAPSHTSNATSSSFLQESRPGASGIPIYNVGTSLIRGHGDREVTATSWTRDGKLVTASDNHCVRHWQEDEAQARRLRTIGEFGGERFGCGWADVGEEWDVEEW